MKFKKKRNLVLLIAITSFIVVMLGGVSYAYYSNFNKQKVDLYDEVLYSELPAKPTDFVIFKREVEKGGITNLCKLEESYWKNPDFYPTWEMGKEIFYDNHDYSRWGVHGYGAYPAGLGMQVENLKQGEQIEFCTFLKTSYGIETYQGIKLVPTENEYFDVQISPQEFEDYPNHVLMKPTFPNFDSDWIKQLHITVTAKKDIPVGTYVIGINGAQPSDEFNDEMIWEILMKDTNEDIEYVKNCVNSIKNKDDKDDECSKFMMERQKKYVPGGGYSIGRDMISITIEVTE